jgi:hypothetical protein
MGNLIPPPPWFETHSFVGYVFIGITIVVVAVILKKLKD